MQTCVDTQICHFQLLSGNVILRCLVGGDFTKFPYVTFLSTGTSDLYMKSIVSVPTTLSFIPLLNLPHSFANDVVQVFAISPDNRVNNVSRRPVILLKTWFICGS